MFLFLVLLNRADQPEKAIERLEGFGLKQPVLVRGRSAEKALSADVAMFGGLRSLVAGADEDRLIFVCPWTGPEDEAKRLLSRVQLELDADQPPSGQIYAVPLLSPA